MRESKRNCKAMKKGAELGKDHFKKKRRNKVWKNWKRTTATETR